MDNIKFFIKLVTTENGQQKVQLNDMFIHVETENDTRFLYFSDKDRVLRKISILDGREIWNYPISADIKSICIDSNYNCYVTTNSDIRKIGDSGKYVSTLNIQSDKTISDGENFYTAKGTKLSKVTQQGQEQFSYNLDSSIKDIATDKLGNIYVATDKDIRKLAKKIIGDKNSKNLLKDTKGIFKGDVNTYGVKTFEIPKGLNGKTITISCYARVTKQGKNTKVRMAMHNNSWTITNQTYSTTNNTEWERISVTCKITTDEYLELGFWNDGQNNGGEVEIKEIQLEIGSTATLYLPNSLDYVNIGEWKYSINSNSIALDSENNIYISTNSNIEKLNTQGQKTDTLDIQADKIALDLEDNLYVSKDKSVEKLSKKMIGDKESKNLLRDTKGVFKGDKYTYGIKTYNLPNLNGKTVTISCKARITKQGTNTNVRMALFNPKWTICIQAHSKNNDTEWQTLVATGTIKTDDKLFLGFWNDGENNGGEVEFKEVQLEIGDKATPYKPNIADYIREGEWKHIDNSEINNIAVG